MVTRTSTVWTAALIPWLLITLPLAAQVGPVARFDPGRSPIELRGPVRSGIYLADQGRRAAVLGSETGGFEVWVWPTKLVRDLDLSFRIPEYDDPIPAAAVAKEVIVRPEGVSVVYSHATFRVEQLVFVPLDEPGAIMLLDVQTVRPLDVLLRMHADFNLAWPGSFGGGYITWDDAGRRFLLSQGGVSQYNAFIGSPFAAGGTSHPAHDAPTVPSQLTLHFDTARATTDFIPVVIAGGAMPRDSADRVYSRLFAGAERYWREKVGHYRDVREDLLSIRSPDAALDLALEWAKVNLDQQLVCNPDLGCGLVAGFGRAGANNYRPGFGWFFGGDAAINSMAMDGLGQFDLVRQGLEFLAEYQRDDGKITHEISQSAGRLPWFTEYPYTFFHGDTTPYWVLACYRYWLASGDDEFVRSMWPRIVRAFRWSASTDGDGDGLMENPLAGAGAIEIGGLGENLLTDIYLAGVWVASLEGVRALAAAAGDAETQREAATLYERARASLESRFWLDGPGIYAFALLQETQTPRTPAGTASAGRRPGQPQGSRPRTNDALTVWPTTAMSFGLLDPERAERMLLEIGSSAITADWGTRMLSKQHALYDPLHYNNGTVWGFVTGFAAMAQYGNHRAWAGHDLVRDVARTTFEFARGRNPELMSGAFYRTLDTAVPQQFFATSMLVSPLVRGLLGLRADAPAGTLVVAPHLPPAWDSLEVSRVRAGEATVDVAVERGDGRYVVRLERTDRDPAAMNVVVSPALPLGARVTAVSVDGSPVAAQVLETAHDVHAAVTVPLRAVAVYAVEFSGGAEVLAPDERLEIGQPSRSLRILDFTWDGNAFVATVEGIAGSTYELGVRSGSGSMPRTVQGAGPAQRRENHFVLPLRIPGSGSEYVRAEIRFTLQ